MRYLLIVVFVNIFFVKPAISSNNKKGADANSGTKETKPPLLIGNITELTLGQSWAISNNIWSNAFLKSKNAYTTTYALTQYFIVNNYLIQSGIEINQFKSNYIYNTTKDFTVYKAALVNDTVNMHYKIVDGVPVREYVIDQRTELKKETVTKNIANSKTVNVSCVTIPLNMGYRWRFDKFALYVKTGTRFNFVTSTKGKLYNTSNKKWIKLNDLINNKFYLSGTINAAFEYPFSALGSIIIEPEYRYNWSSCLNHGIINNYSQFGLKVGLQIWL